jgi:flagellar biogenesis protein FliO
LIVSVGTLGGVVAGQLYQADQKPRYLLGNAIAFTFVSLQTILVVILRFIFLLINRQRSRMNVEEIQKQIQQYGGNELAGDRHPEFRYTL